jgi:hypothetical protein
LLGIGICETILGKRLDILPNENLQAPPKCLLAGNIDKELVPVSSRTLWASTGALNTDTLEWKWTAAKSPESASLRFA